MQNQRRFFNITFLIALLSIMVIFGAVYFIVEQKLSQTIPESNFDNKQDSLTVQNQTPENQTGTKSAVQNISKEDFESNEVSEEQQQVVLTNNNFDLTLEKLSDYSQKTQKEYGTYGNFYINNNEIVYTDFGAISTNEVPPFGCTLPITNINTALVFPSIDFRYIIADGKLFWRCDIVGSIDTVNLRAFSNPFVVLNDGKIVVVEGKRLDISDPKTFNPVTYSEGQDANERNFTNYYMDSVSVYYTDEEDALLKKLANANPSTFEMLTGGQINNYAKDANHVYFNGVVLPTKYPKEFEVLLDGLLYAIDSDSIYNKGKSIVTGIKKNDIEVYGSNLPVSQQYGGTQDILIKNNNINKWQLYKFDDMSLSKIPTPSSKEIGLVLFPKP